MTAFKKYRKTRVIDWLRKRYPGEWQFDRKSGYRWIGPDFTVIAYSELNNSYDGDESFRTSYFREDTNERLYIF